MKPKSVAIYARVDMQSDDCALCCLVVIITLFHKILDKQPSS